MEATVKKSKASEVVQRVKAGKCLLCDGDAKRRGLCDSHYRMFHRQLNQKSSTDQVEFEASAIREGLVLPVGEQRKITSDDPFAKL